MFYHIKKRGHLSEKEAKFYGAELILGLEYIHSQKVIYRDLKPENLLLDKDGHLKMADFGICKMFDDKVNVTTSVIGTPQYLAPEINVGFGGYDYRVDIWSLGCCLYEIVAGDPPFRGP